MQFVTSTAIAADDIRRMEEFVGASSILVLASHSLPILQEWCNRAILLERGRIISMGDVEEIAAVYQQAA